MDFLGKKCPVCSKNFHEDDDIVVCPKCGAPYHRECYKEKGKCIFTELHKKGEMWHDEDEEEESAALDVCPHCGRKNPKGAVTCYICGGFMHPTDKDNDTSEKNKTNFDDENEENNNSNPVNPFGENMPFAAFIDPMGGVSPDEDFDGVSGAEMAKCVKVNTPYYMQVFSRIKTINSSRFNFSAFLFGGGWYLYRKQYLKGTIITVIMFLLMLGRIFFGRMYANSWTSLTDTLRADGKLSPGYLDYLSLIFSKYSVWEGILILMPLILTVLSFVLMLWCGLRGNRNYYKHTIAKIKKLKEEKNGEELTKTITEHGGVNIAIAWSLLACAIIINISTLFL